MCCCQKFENEDSQYRVSAVLAYFSGSQRLRNALARCDVQSVRLVNCFERLYTGLCKDGALDVSFVQGCRTRPRPGYVSVHHSEGRCACVRSG